jgi:membrane protease YdiL (CAAX protease family)
VKILQPILDAFRGPQLQPTVILLSASVLLLTWKYGFSIEVYQQQFGGQYGRPEVAGAVYHFLGCLLLLGVLPAIIVRAGFGERLRDYGLGLGDRARTFRSFALLAPMFVLVAWLSSDDAAILQKFPINRAAGQSPAMFGLHAVTYLTFYLGWEFFFRGFLLFGLRGTLGAVNAVLIQTLASSLLHIGSPASETFGAILAGLLWGALALRTGSLWSGLGQHFLLGISLDFFICYG